MYRGGSDIGGDLDVGIVLRLKEQLDLSDEQVLKLKAIKEEVKEQFKTSADAVRAKREALREAVESGATGAAIRAAAVEVGGALGDQAVLRAGTKAKVYVVLTDAQQAKLQEPREQRLERRKQWRDEGRGRMGRRPRGRRGPARARGPESAFARIDADGNGAISLDEFETHMPQIRERHEGKGPRGWGRPRP
jgi:Spy/CpxP family protein refolding chaperone